MPVEVVRGDWAGGVVEGFIDRDTGVVDEDVNLEDTVRACEVGAGVFENRGRSGRRRGEVGLDRVAGYRVRGGEVLAESFGGGAR